MQRIYIALSALISREQYRLKRASKVAKTDGQTAKLGRQNVGPAITQKARRPNVTTLQIFFTYICM